MNTKKQNIEPRNADHQRHGYCELYSSNGQLYFKSNFINGELIDYVEWWGSKKQFYLR